MSSNKGTTCAKDGFLKHEHKIQIGSTQLENLCTNDSDTNIYNLHLLVVKQVNYLCEACYQAQQCTVFLRMNIIFGFPVFS